MLTRLGLGRTALLQASAIGLLAFATALAVGAAAWLAGDETSHATAATAFAVRKAPQREAAMATFDDPIGERALLEDPAAADVAPWLASRVGALNDHGPLLMMADAGGFFRIHDAVPRPAAETTPEATAAWTITTAPAAAALDEPPETLVPGDRARATISFYYCEYDPESINPPGDGGGFCGLMRDGNVVHEGAAACAYEYLGQRFRILSDPTERTYICADTGSAVGGLHRDIWFHAADEGWDWLWLTGATATIEVLP